MLEVEPTDQRDPRPLQGSDRNGNEAVRAAAREALPGGCTVDVPR